MHTTEVIVEKSGALQVTSGIQGLALLKTTQAGFEGFIRDKYTALADTRERIVATEVTASWRYPFESLSGIPLQPLYFTEKYLDVKKVLAETFFGPPRGGVYSPSVQSTLYQMAKNVLNRFPDISSIQLKMPNLHFLPVNISSKDNPAIVKQMGRFRMFPWTFRIFYVPLWEIFTHQLDWKCLNQLLDTILIYSSEWVLQFDDDVYLPTSEPHGSIEATVSRIRAKM
ncbi:Uricase-2 [Vitis vinifera]|uniref:Uricase n=1 Tax=Vitis vinifera TaxID=29760 RepID=A0A438CSE9_VITVI|nr:Uricase-2 [Vitis vinifera]